MESKSKNIYGWGMRCHLCSLAWLPLSFIFVPPLGIPPFGVIPPFAFVNIIGPLVVWFAKKDESEFIDAHGRESINFQVSMTLYGIGLLVIFWLLLVLLIFFGVIGRKGSIALLTDIKAVFHISIMVLFGILQLTLAIFVAVKAKKGQMYRYPLTIRLL